MAYRLGAFGFLADPELTRENASGHFGLEDMVAGLKWVKNGIAKFGGNPSRVTIFGESDDGITVSMALYFARSQRLLPGRFAGRRVRIV